MPPYPPRPPVNPEFQAVVQEIAAGRSTRELYKLTNVSHSTIASMLDGIVPKYSKLQEFAELCDEKVNPITRSFFEKAKKFFK